MNRSTVFAIIGALSALAGYSYVNELMHDREIERVKGTMAGDLYNVIDEETDDPKFLDLYFRWIGFTGK